MKRALFFGLICFVSASIVNAQFLSRLSNPTVDVKLTHPPGLGIKVSRVAFLSERGQCAGDFKHQLIDMFVSNGAQVAEREAITSILNEHDFAASGYMDARGAAKMGKIIGPTTLIYLDVHQCGTERNQSYQDRKDKEGNIHRTYYSKTDGYFKVSMRVVDLETARIFSSKTLEGFSNLENYSEKGWPDFPSNYEARDNAMRQTLNQASRLFFSWDETKSLVFFNNKRGNLKAAYQRLKIGDIEGAFELSSQNLTRYQQEPKQKPSILSHAYYNMGMMHFIRLEYDLAIEYFEAAYQTKRGEIITEAIRECRRAKELEQEMARVDERMSLAEEAPVASTPRPQEPRGEVSAPVQTQPSQPAPQSDVESRLIKLKSLYDKGLLTKAEYQAKRKEILADL